MEAQITTGRLRSRDDLSLQEAQAKIRAHQRSAPVKVSQLAETLGLPILVSPLGPNNSGKIYRDKTGRSPSGFFIEVNRDEAYVRQRFTAAHEIAHFILHRDLIIDSVSDDVLYRSGLSSPVEAEANNLAADILMPWHLIRKATDEGKTTVADLAAYFDVSQIAMSIRLGSPT